MERASDPAEVCFRLPHRTAFVLCGSAGSGKSTFARRLVQSCVGLQETSIVSSDFCRQLVCDDATNQHATRDAFDLFHFLIHKRMLQNRFILADSTALTSQARHRLIALAQAQEYYTFLLIFDLPLDLCRQQNGQRDRIVEDTILAKHALAVQQALADVPREGWNAIRVLRAHDFSFRLEFSDSSC